MEWNFHSYSHLLSLFDIFLGKIWPSSGPLFLPLPLMALALFPRLAVLCTRRSKCPWEQHGRWPTSSQSRRRPNPECCLARKLQASTPDTRSSWTGRESIDLYPRMVRTQSMPTAETMADLFCGPNMVTCSPQYILEINGIFGEKDLVNFRSWKYVQHKSKRDLRDRVWENLDWPGWPWDLIVSLNNLPSIISLCFSPVVYMCMCSRLAINNLKTCLEREARHLFSKIDSHVRCHRKWLMRGLNHRKGITDVHSCPRTKSNTSKWTPRPS